MRWIMSLGAAALVFGLALSVAADKDEDEQKVSIDQVPPAVKATILKEANGAPVNQIERDTEGGSTVYEAEWAQGGKEVEIKVAPDGRLLGKEVEEADDDDEGDDDGGDDEDDDDDGEEVISFEQAPAAVKAAIRRYAGDVKIERLGREPENGVMVYEAKWRGAAGECELEVSQDGVLLEMKTAMAPGNMPSAVRTAAAGHHSDGRIVRCWQKTVVVYEVQKRSGSKHYTFAISPTGKIITTRGKRVAMAR